MRRERALLRLAGVALCLLGALAQAAGLTEIAGRDGDGPVTVVYPSSSAAALTSPRRPSARLRMRSAASAADRWCQGVERVSA